MIHHTASTDATDIPPTFRAASPSLLPLDNVAQRLVENSPRFVSRGKHFQISTMNTRTLNPTSRMHELMHAASLNKNDIICIQEHCQHHQSLLSYQCIDGYQLITASATKNSINATVGGVGFLVSPKAQKSLLSVEKVNIRIILLHLNGSPNIIIICVYAPTNTSEAADKTSFYVSLFRTAASIPPHHLLAVCGDFNAKLEPDNALHTATNENGELLHDVAEQHRLVTSPTHDSRSRSRSYGPMKILNSYSVKTSNRFCTVVKNCQQLV